MTRDEEFIPSVAVARFRGDLHGMPAEEANGVLTQLLADISRDCGAEGGIIGHNKANFRCGDDLLSISCTTDDGNVRSKSLFAAPVGSITGVMDVIVYELDYAVMKRIVEERAKALPGLEVSVLENQLRCNDPNCKDPNCTNPEHMG